MDTLAIVIGVVSTFVITALIFFFIIIDPLKKKLLLFQERLGYLEGVKEEHQRLTQTHNELQKDFTALEINLNNERENAHEKIDFLQTSKEQLKHEFQALSQQILQQHSQTFTAQNQEKLLHLLSPIQEQFKAFQKQIDDVYIKEAKERSMLQVEVKNIRDINNLLTQEAKNLTKALKGESKKQGIWGEMVLQSILENSALREGVEYKCEVSLHDDMNVRYRPDVIVYLPEGRELVIDAKTSLVAYEKFVNSEGSEQHGYLQEHIGAIKNHINTLSDKAYQNLNTLSTVDFVFMFMPIESALSVAMHEDVTLFDYAYKKNIILVSPTSLMVSLRAVESSWKYEHVQDNAQEIATQAAALFDKFALIVEGFEKLGKQIVTVQKTYDEVQSRVNVGHGNLVSRFQKLKELGISTKKEM